MRIEFNYRGMHYDLYPDTREEADLLKKITEDQRAATDLKTLLKYIVADIVAVQDISEQERWLKGE